MAAGVEALKLRVQDLEALAVWLSEQTKRMSDEARTWHELYKEREEYAKRMFDRVEFLEKEYAQLKLDYHNLEAKPG